MDDLERLRVAYSFDVLLQVALADGAFDERELAVLEQAWPPGTLERYGFVDDDGPTPALRAAAAEARRVLPAQMTESQKLLLLGFFHTACLADGSLHPNEIGAVQQAARDLGISQQQLGAHLDQLTGVSTDAPPRRGT